MLVLLFLLAGPLALSDAQEKIQQCCSPDDPRLQEFCPMPSAFDKNYRCWVTSNLECEGIRYVGHGSICQERHTGSAFVYKCTAQGWTQPGPDQNKPPRFSNCPQQVNHDAAPGRSSAVVHYAVPTASDPNGGSPSVTLVSGPASGSVFQQGKTFIKYRARDSGGLTDYCEVTVNVSVKYCTVSAPIFTIHGNQSCTGDKMNINGAVCSFSCEPGYELSGPSSVTCQADSQWSDSFPSCNPVSCGTPALVTRGHLSCPHGYVYPESCIVTCDPGYKLIGSMFITCQSNRIWTTSPSCTDIEPPKFPSGCPSNQKLYSGPLQAPVALTWVDPVVTDNSGQNVTLTSSVALGSMFAPGFHVVSLTAIDGAGNNASCSFVVTVEAKRCPGLAAPANSYVTCSHGYVEGSTCTVTCDLGHDLKGNSTVTCLGTQQWDSALPVCEAVKCPGPPVVEYGSFVCGGGYTYQSVCVLECLSGFSPQSPLTIECLHNKTWSVPGSCLDVEAPTFPNGCTSNVEIYAARLGNPNLIQWNDPAVTDNSAKPVTLSSDITSGSPFPVGVTHVTYTATDVTGNSGNCQFSVTVTSLSCPVPDLEAPNRTITLMTYDCPSGHIHGASCTLACMQGYPLVGADTITCERDDSTYPPTMFWEWSGPSSVPPQCQANNCPTLAPPQNGALACFLGNYGWDCMMSCNARWDIPSHTDGHFYCTNSNGFWTPSSVPDCTRRYLPFRVRMQTDLFYFTGSCNTSIADIQQNFITRINNSTWKDACLNVPSCVLQNVQVYCGSLSTFGRRKREATLLYDDSAFHHSSAAEETRKLLSRARRQAGTSHYVLVTFEIVMEYTETTTAQAAYQTLITTADDITAKLRAEADAGFFNLGQLVTDQYGVGFPTFGADCPSGTVFIAKHGASSFTCAGCGAGYYLPVGSSQCEACPVGSYADVDNATSCTSCPPGWSTLSTASKNISQCKELCKAGSASFDGFVPCQSCTPGQYQSRDGATTCDLCPAGTFTDRDGSTDFNDCLPADVHLSNSSLSAKMTDQASEFTLSLWVWLPSTSKGYLSMEQEASSLDNITAVITTTNSTLNVLQNSNAALLSVPQEKWTQLLFMSDTQNGGTNVYIGDSLVNTFSSTLFSTSLSTVTVTSLDGEVIVSGMHAMNRSLNQAEIQSLKLSCVTSSVPNLMTWSPRASDVTLPGTCDALDECAQSPCGPHRCENQASGFVCHCQAGWTGVTCSTPPGACYDHQCLHGATCVATNTITGNSNNSSPYTCLCPPEYGGTFCRSLKVHGGWGAWSPWSDCSATCGGQRERTRLCNNPSPFNGGDSCTGIDKEFVLCGPMHCPVDGNWTNWSQWTSCSAPCEGGTRTRNRTCTNPSPLHGGTLCDGSESETEVCNTHICPVHGGYTDWSVWSPCSVTCGDGQTTRERTCDSPAPANGGNPCSGPANETQPCNLGECPECSPLIRSRGTLLICEEVTSPYLKACNLTCAPGFVSTSEFPLYTCGEETGYLWNNQRDSSSQPILPACSRPSYMSQVRLSQTMRMSATCDSTTSSALQTGAIQNVNAKVPCVPLGTCSTSVSTACGSNSRKRRSTQAMVLTFSMVFTFNSSGLVDENDTTTISQYQQYITSIESSAQVVENDTALLFSIPIGGQYVTPDMTSVSYSAAFSCPAGSTFVNSFCVECPAGSKEEGGQCVLCPLGQYQDQSGSTSCLSCPAGLTWDLPGASNISQCVLPLTGSSSNQDSAGTADSSMIAIIAGAVCGTVAIIGLTTTLLIVLLKNEKSQGQVPTKTPVNKVHPELIYAAPLYSFPSPPSRPQTPGVFWDEATDMHYLVASHPSAVNQLPPIDTKC